MPRISKRKRVSRVPTDIRDEEEIETNSAQDGDGEPELHTDEPEYHEENGDADHRLDVSPELWDSFREEFHEGM